MQTCDCEPVSVPAHVDAYIYVWSAYDRTRARMSDHGDSPALFLTLYSLLDSHQCLVSYTFISFKENGNERNYHITVINELC